MFAVVIFRFWIFETRNNALCFQICWFDNVQVHVFHGFTCRQIVLSCVLFTVFVNKTKNWKKPAACPFFIGLKNCSFACSVTELHIQDFFVNSLWIFPIPIWSSPSPYHDHNNNNNRPCHHHHRHHRSSSIITIITSIITIVHPYTHTSVINHIWSVIGAVVWAMILLELLFGKRLIGAVIW